MSQVFSGDSVNGTPSATITTASETSAATGNFLNPPFQNAKAIVTGNLAVGTGTGTTNLILRIRRNPSAENLIVSASNNITVTAVTTVCFSFQAADVIPDGRPVQYSLTVTQLGATGNGIVYAANISTLLISG